MLVISFSDFSIRVLVCIGSDNGPESIAQALQNCCEESTITSMAQIAPESPWHKGRSENFEVLSTYYYDSGFSAEFLNIELFTIAPKAQSHKSWPTLGIEITTLSIHTPRSKSVSDRRQIKVGLWDDCIRLFEQSSDMA